MRLRTKLFIILLVFFALYVFMADIVARLVIAPYITGHEEERAYKDLRDRMIAVRQQMNAVERLADDWAHWDALRQFVDDGNVDFENAYLTARMLRSINVDYLYILDHERRVVWGGGESPTTTAPLTVENYERDRWPADHPLILSDPSSHAVTGLDVTPRGLAIVASCPIASQSDPIARHGTIVMGRFLDAADSDSIRNDIQFRIEPCASIYRPTDPPAILDFLERLGAMSPEDLPQCATELRVVAATSVKQYQKLPIEFHSEDDSIYVLLNLYDIHGNPSVCVAVIKSRLFMDLGMSGAMLAFASIMILGMFTAIALLVVVNYMITLPIYRLNKHVAAIGRSQDLSQRLNLRKRDEIGVLVQEFNHMLERLEIEDRLRRQAEEELRVNETRLRRILDTTIEGFFMMDRNSRIIDVNQALCWLLGRERRRIVGKYPWDLLAPDPEGKPLDKEAWQEHCSNDGSDHLTFEASFLNQAGESIPFLVHCSAFRNDEREVVGRIVFLSDMTEIKQAEALREDVQRITRHDMKSPLVSVINFPQILKTHANLTDEQRDILERIEQAGYRLLKMINLSLDLFKMEKQTYTLNPQPVDLLPLLARIAGDFEREASLRGVQLDLCLNQRPIRDGDRFEIQGEELLCYTMFANLIKNAMEASPPSQRVTIDCHSSDTPTVAIHNAGVIPEAIRERFFEKYATHGKEKGTGLGAYSARLIAQTHGGSIDFETSDATGTTITVRFVSPPAQTSESARPTP